MRATLSLQPLHTSYAEILKSFYEGKPLTADQLNFLRRYHAKLSDSSFDRVLNYYKVLNTPSVDYRKVNLDRNKLKALKEHISSFVHGYHQSFKVHVTPKQFFQIRTLLAHELIYFHGNQVLTGAPYYPGGVPHVDFMQWGNLFGVIKYEEIPGETAVDANILIAFEEMADRNVEQCIEQFRHVQSASPAPQAVFVTPNPQNQPMPQQYQPTPLRYHPKPPR